LEIRPSTGTAVNLPAVEVANSSTLLPELRNSCARRASGDKRFSFGLRSLPMAYHWPSLP